MSELEFFKSVFKDVMNEMNTLIRYAIIEINQQIKHINCILNFILKTIIHKLTAMPYVKWET